MRILEIVLVVLVVGAALCRLFGFSRNGLRWLAGPSLAAALLHVVLEGAHWQMIPAYAGLIAVCGMAWIPAGRTVSILTAWAAILLAVASVGCCWALPMFRLPRPTGPYPVGTAMLYLKDPTRLDDASPGGRSPRELAVQIWYPAVPSHNGKARYREWRESRFVNSYQSEVWTDSRWNAPVANTGGPLPVVLFDPGWHGRRSQNTTLVEDLASHGYFVAAIDHPYNARQVAFPDGRVVEGAPAPDVSYPDGSTAPRVRAVWDRELAKWVADGRFVLDRLEAMNADAGSPWLGKLDTRREAAVGHSFGGAASTALCAADARIRAAVNLDGWFFGAIRMRGAHQPLLAMFEGPPHAGPYPHPDVEQELNMEDVADTNASLRRFGGYRVYVDGANHEDFTDQALLSPLRAVNQRGTVPAAEMETLVRAYVLAFLDKTLRGADPAILHPGAALHPETHLEVWPEAGDAAASAGDRREVR